MLSLHDRCRTQRSRADMKWFFIPMISILWTMLHSSSEPLSGTGALQLLAPLRHIWTAFFQDCRQMVWNPVLPLNRLGISHSMTPSSVSARNTQWFTTGTESSRRSSRNQPNALGSKDLLRPNRPEPPHPRLAGCGACTGLFSLYGDMNVDGCAAHQFRVDGNGAVHQSSPFAHAQQSQSTFIDCCMGIETAPLI
jgi:hypothetical protein